MLQSVPCHGRDCLFVLIPDNNNNNKSDNNLKAKAEKAREIKAEDKFTNYIGDTLDGGRDVDPSSALAS